MREQGPLVLLVDDERSIRRFLHISLASHGYAICEAANGQDALAAVSSRRPDMVILDLGLPDIEGVEVTRRIREWNRLPIIILSVRDREGDKIAALDAGADDYLTKPFGVGELLARLRVALRHAAPAASGEVFSSGDLKVDLTRRLVTVQDREIELTPTEYDLLRALVQNAGKVMTHRQLLRLVWGASYEAETHLLRVNISNLRRRLEPDPAQPRYIVTDPGVGYRLRENA